MKHAIYTMTAALLVAACSDAPVTEDDPDTGVPSDLCEPAGLWSVTLIPNDGEGTCGLSSADTLPLTFELVELADGSFEIEAAANQAASGAVFRSPDGICRLTLSIEQLGDVLDDGTTLDTALTLTLDLDVDAIDGDGNVEMTFRDLGGEPYWVCLQPLTARGTRR